MLMPRLSSIRRAVVALILAISLVAAIFGALPAANGRTGAETESVEQTSSGSGFARHPLILKVHGHDAGATPIVTNATPHGYTPAQVRAYLGLSGDGSGQTIALVDAYDHPTIVDDVNKFSTTFGLPLVCGTPGATASNCFNFTKATPQGKTRSDAGWALEIALDVEWAHAVAPKASILLVEAKSNAFNNLFAAIDYAAQSGAAVISNSWGATEFNGEASWDAHCTLTSAVCTASSGDAGNPGLYPAYNPSVIAVGGTTLGLDAVGGVTGEAAWSGSGGGVSKYESKPTYQTSYKASTFPFSKRVIPDVSYDADPGTGFAVYDSVPYQNQTGWFQLGGTSAGAPQWAAIIAVTDQLRGAAGKSRLTSATFQMSAAAYAQPASSARFDVGVGSNGTCGDVCSAAVGFDAVTGLGSPRSGIDAALASAP